MKVLGIETSCDDTAIAVLEVQDGCFQILSNVVSSQVEIHQKWGGVVPRLARREHEKNLVPVLKEALLEAGLLKKVRRQNAKSTIQRLKLHEILQREPELCKQLTRFLGQYEKPAIDLIGVTTHPGLEPALWVGINFAKSLGSFWDISVVGVNHLEGHLLIALLSEDGGIRKDLFPAVGLIVSGGHTILVLVKEIGSYQTIGETRDDAAGECFDKTARILGLGYPGGPAIAQRAAQWNSQFPMVRQAPRPRARGRMAHHPEQSRGIPNSPTNSKHKIRLPRPMINTKDYDFSFSWLKTAVLYHHQRQSEETKKSKDYIRAMAAEIQQAIVEVLIAKTIKAAKEYQVKRIILGGGVAANEELRNRLKQTGAKMGVMTLVPPKDLCTDNGVMIALAAFSRHTRGEAQDWKNLQAHGTTKL